MPRKTNCTKNGQEYYRVTASLGRDSSGKLIRKEFYGISKAEAEEKRDKFLEDYRKGLNTDTNAALGPTMHTWLFEVVRVSDNIKPSTFERYEGIYRNYVKESAIYNCTLRTLKSIDLQRYYNELYEKQGKSSSIIRNLHKLLRCFLNYAVDEGYLLSNPCTGKRITIPGEVKSSKREIEVFFDDELIAFQEAIAGHQYEALFLLALGTGLREGELIALEKDDVDIKMRCVSVDETMRKRYVFKADGTKEYKLVKGATKNRQTRTVPFPAKLVPKLRAYMAQKKVERMKAGPAYNDEGYFFSNATGGPIDTRSLLRSYARVLKRANIPYRKFHALRHTYATKLFEKDLPLKKVQMLLGHNRPETTDIYTHIKAENIVEAADKINELLL